MAHALGVRGGPSNSHRNFFLCALYRGRDDYAIALSLQALEHEATALCKSWCHARQMIAQLLEAFVTNQTAADEQAGRSQRQAWIGIAVAVAFGLLPIVLLFAGMD